MNWRQDKKRFGPHPWLLQPAFWAVSVYRFGRWTLTAPTVLRKPAHVLYFGLYSVVRLVTGIEIPRTATIGGGLMIHHFGGVIIGPEATIGANCTLRHGVTIGKKDEDGRSPVLEDGVNVGAYAQIFGDITVGANSTIGSMAVVFKDIPPNSVVVGNPARVVRAGSKSIDLPEETHR